MVDVSEEPRPHPLDEDDGGGPVKPFLEHLEDLRWVIIQCLSALALGMVVCMMAAPYLVQVLTWPLVNSGSNIELKQFSPIAGFTIWMKIAFYGGIVLALPFILYFIGSYIKPALKRRERKYFLRAFIIGAGLFLAGVLMCYFVALPIMLQAIPRFNEWIGLPADMWRAEDYFHIVIMFMMGMGLSFEVPVLLLTLVRLGVIPHATFAKGRRYFFVANLIICSFITPDFISTIFLVVPVQLILEVCIWISAYWDRQKRAAEAALLSGQVNQAVKE